ncbi:dehydrogenase [Klebsiella pneumoniae]|uniref:Dehydrogenase n=1 Tax=Klebsiella pneumoniae TaxID=573 RepID=A0A2X3H6F5_KLEPN|nr:dehydrogenase [Klebsiella pneumoniae]
MNAAIARLQNEVPGAKARPAIADLSDADGAAQLLRAVTGVDILVNNAGIYGPQDFYATDDATWDKLLADQRHVRRTPVAGAAPGDGQ